MSHLELHAQLKIRPGQLQTFTTQAAETVRLARERDTQTLRFDWFINQDGTQCEVHETYESDAAFFEHTQHIAKARAKLFGDSVDGHHVTAYGDVPQRLIDMANVHASGLERYTFLQGLQPEPTVDLSAVPRACRPGGVGDGSHHCADHHHAAPGPQTQTLSAHPADGTEANRCAST